MDRKEPHDKADSPRPKRLPAVPLSEKARRRCQFRRHALQCAACQNMEDGFCVLGMRLLREALD